MAEIPLFYPRPGPSLQKHPEKTEKFAATHFKKGVADGGWQIADGGWRMAVDG